MDMLDYRLHYAVMATEDRIRDLRRQQGLQARRGRAGWLLRRRPEGRGRR